MVKVGESAAYSNYIRIRKIFQIRQITGVV